MSLGKDSIAKRVAKPAESTPAPAPVKKTPAKNTTPKTVKTATITNVAPATVEKAVGHKENAAFEKVSLGEALPAHLL